MVRGSLIVGLLVGVLVTGIAAASLLDDSVVPGGRTIGSAFAEMLRPIQWTHPDLISRTMQLPDCWTLYRRHRTAGGAMSYREFAHGYAATGGYRRR
jgi:hypothetical protein